MDKVNVMLEPLRVFLTQIGAILPRLALAVAVLIAGWPGTRAALWPTTAMPTSSTCRRGSSFERSTRKPGMDSSLSSVPPV